MENYDYYTVTVDTIGQTNKSEFSVFLTESLKNVVQARLLATHIRTSNLIQHVYVSVNELNSVYSERTSNVFEGQGDISKVRGAFASISSSSFMGVEPDQTISFRERSDYPISVEYSEPLRRVSRLSVSLLDSTGSVIPAPVVTTEENFLVFQFKCKSPGVIRP